jgi:transcriptional antiterminator RfaH
MQRWYVVHTQSYQEARAELNLRRQGFEVWLPLSRRRRRHARRIDTVLAPLFPR